MKFFIENEKKMDQWGIAIGKMLKSGDVIALIGDLGAGKTTLSKSMGKAIGIREEMTSPSYAIVNEYHCNLGLIVHADVYRLEDEEALYEIGFDDYFYDASVMIIEWADKVIELLESETKQLIKIYISYKGDGRQINIDAYDEFIERAEGVLDDFSS